MSCHPPFFRNMVQAGFNSLKNKSFVWPLSIGCTFWELVIVSDDVLPLGCVWCAYLCITSDGVQISVCMLGFSAGCVFVMLRGGDSVWCVDVLWRDISLLLELLTSSLRCLQFLQRTCPVGVLMMQDCGSVHTCLTIAGVHFLISWSCTLTSCPVSRLDRSFAYRLCYFFCNNCLWIRHSWISSFWAFLLVHFVGRLLTSFRLNSSSTGDGITWSIGVDRRHSRHVYVSVA